MKGVLKEHNIPVYEKLEEMMNEKNKALIVTATGTGKSYLTLEYITKHNLNTLVVVPRISIGREWDKMSKKISTITYHSFVRTHNFDKYDCIVFDEVHHAGAQTWEIPITHFIETTDKKVIGLTADPKRYSDGARDMGKALFEGCRVDGYDLTHAIENNILPKLTYVAALWDVGTMREKYSKKDIPSPLMARFNYALDKRKPVEEIIAAHMPNGDRKGIIFVETISACKPAEELIKSIYSDAKIWTIHSKQSSSINEKYHNAFKKAKKGYMIAVDMYNEGLHAPGVNTIIMLRRTASPTIFYQQIGRALHVGDANNPIIFDLVYNSDLLKVTSTQRPKFTGPSLVKITPLISNQTVVFDYTKDILDVIESIEYELDDTWTDEELAVLAEYYPIEGSEVYKRLPGRSFAACKVKAERMRILFDNHAWSEEEDEILKQFYEVEGDYIYKRLKDRTRSACRARATVLGLKHEEVRYWKTYEDEIITKYYPTEGLNVLKRLNGRSKSGVQVRAKKLGVEFIGQKKKWSDEEIEILKKYYPTEGKKIAERLPGRTVYTITAKAKSLGIKSNGLNKTWTAEEDEILRTYYPTEGKHVAKRIPNHTEKQCSARACKYGIRKLKGDKDES